MQFGRQLLAVGLAGFIATIASAQGYIRWPSQTQQLRGYLVETGVHAASGRAVFTVYYTGWTAMALGTEGDSHEGGGVSVPGSVSPSTVTGLEFTDSETGSTAEAAALFPFVADATMSSVLGQRAIQLGYGNTSWWGFLAKVTSPVPAYRPGALAFTFESVFSPESLVTALAQARVAVVEANSDGTLVQGGQQSFVLASAAEAACIAYYKFDRGMGSIALNQSGFPGAAVAGKIMTGAASGWGGGRFGSALRGSDITAATPVATSCDTGWSGPLYGGFTVAWFMRERHAHAARVSHLFSGPGGFRVFTGGPAGRGLRCVEWGGGPIRLGVDIQALARAGWVHVALAVNGVTRQARWYVNGVSRGAMAIGANVAIPFDPRTLKIGMFDQPGTASAYDIDEFRLCYGARSGAEIGRWSMQADAAGVGLGSTCGVNLRSLGGAPAAGNSSYRLQVEGPPATAFAVGLGTPLIPPLDLGLAFPALSGCLLHGSFTVALPGVTDANGWGGVALMGIPASTPRGAFYAQGVFLRAPLAVSNAHVTAIE